MSRSDAVDRREFLQASAAAISGLVLSGQFMLRAQGPTQGPRAIPMNAWIRIGTDDVVTLVASQAEMGQGAGTTLPAILAEELGADWTRVRIEQAPTAKDYQNPRINWQFTGNSESTTGFFDLLRRMGASARTMLVEAAAERWRVPPRECVVSAGIVSHPTSGRRLRFGELVEEASRRTPPQQPQLREPAEWTLLGRSLGRVDVPWKLDGSAVFGLDFRLPGMLYAAVELAPTFGGTLRRHDRTPAISMPGVADVVEIPGGIAVVADRYWRARTALEATPIEWNDGPSPADSREIMAKYAAALGGDQWIRAKLTGDRPSGGATVTADYESQFLAHATMEPMNCTASVTRDRCEIWGPIQGQDLTRYEVAAALNMPPDRVFVNRTLVGGGFGRRLLTDFARQAALVSRAVGRPVQVVWSRETDMRHGAYRPAVANRLTATVNAAGEPVGLAHRIVSPSILQYIYPPVKEMPFDPSCLEGTLESHYEIPFWEVEFHQLAVPVPTSVLRTTGYGPNVFAIESFIDELAHRARQDPYLYRRRLLRGNSRAQAVLDLAAEKSRGSGSRHQDDIAGLRSRKPSAR